MSDYELVKRTPHKPSRGDYMRVGTVVGFISAVLTGGGACLFGLYAAGFILFMMIVMVFVGMSYLVHMFALWAWSKDVEEVEEALREEEQNRQLWQAREEKWLRLRQEGQRTEDKIVFDIPAESLKVNVRAAILGAGGTIPSPQDKQGCIQVSLPEGMLLLESGVYEAIWELPTQVRIVITDSSEIVLYRSSL